jgi:hypothetical protein
MNEAELMEEVRAACKQLGLHAFHARDSRGSWGPGFPDLVIAGPGGILYRECKGRDGVLQPNQRQWGSVITRAGGNWRVWRPRDLTGHAIMNELLAIAGTAERASA